jgi:hypothetical protein
LILPAFLVLSTTKKMVGFLPVVLSVIALLNAGYMAAMWFAYRPEYAAMKSSFRLIERGAFVLVGRSSSEPIDSAELPIFHAPVLAVHYAKAFVPSLFTIPGQYALQARPELKRLDIAAAEYYGPLPFSVLAAVSKGHVSAEVVPSHLACWVNDFDYLYLVGRHGLNPMPDRLTEIAAAKRFALFRIRKSLGEKCSEN